MQDLIRRAEKAAQLLKDRRETIAVAESSTGGLISAALLALPGASAYFLGGAVVYTQVARRALLDLPDIAPLGMRASTEALCAAAGADRAAALLGELGAGGERRHRPDRQPLRRRRRP
jgi:nicotinamide-nucleotide amidase